MIIHTKSPEETSKLAFDFAKQLKGGEIICLSGDLGAGKTLFAQGLGKGLGVKEFINSPTFTIVNEYEGRLKLYHFDVYRICDPEEMYEIGIDEYLFSDGVCLIEWAELIRDILPENCIEIKISADVDNPETDRDIIIENFEFQKGF